MRKLVLVIIMMLVCSGAWGQCTGEILDVEHAEDTSSGSQYKFITQYTCNGQIVDVGGQPCDNCKQGNRVGGDKTVEEATVEAEAEISIHAKNLNARYGNNAEKLKNEKIKIYAESKGVDVAAKDIEQIKSELKAIQDAERTAMFKSRRDNVVANIDAVKTAVVGYSATVDKYTETFMDKKIEVSTDEKVIVSDISALEPIK